MNLIFVDHGELKAKVQIYAEQQDKGVLFQCCIFDGQGELIGLCGTGDLLTFISNLTRFLPDYIDPKWKAVLV